LVETTNRASPVAWLNINLKGKYLFTEGGETLGVEYLMAPIEDYMPAPKSTKALQASDSGM